MRLSLRGYARHRGCRLSTVQRAIERGRIAKTEDGKIDQAAADAAWQSWAEARSLPARPALPLLEAVPELPPLPPLIEQEAAFMSPAASNSGASAPGPLPQAAPSPVERISEGEAKRRKEAALMKLRELEVAEKEGRLLPKEAVRERWVSILGEVRSNLLRVPDKIAPELAAADTPAEARAIVWRELEAVLRRVSDEIGNGGERAE